MSSSKIYSFKNLLKRGSALFLLLVLIFSLVACDPYQFLADDPNLSKESKKITESSHKDKDKDKEEDIIALIENRNFKAIYPLLTVESRSNNKLEDIVQRQEQIDERLGFKSLELINLQKLKRASDERIAIYEATALFQTAYGEMKRPLTLTFLYDDKAERWFLEYSPSLIFPGLTRENDLLIQRLDAHRGSIYDRNGLPLAVDGKGQVVGAISGLYDIANNAVVAELLNMPVEKVDAIMSQSWIKDDMYVPIKHQTEFSAEQLDKFPELHLEMRLYDTRIYPYGPSIAHLIGYVGEISQEELDADERGVYRERDQIGKTGLEKYFEEELRPKDGVRVYLSGEEKQILYERPAEQGQDLNLTIDIKLQDKLYKLFKEDEGQLVTMDPRNGDILALLSFPAYDPNEFVLGISNDSYQKLLDDPRLPLWNKFQVAYAPGSTMKVPTSIAAFAAGSLTPETSKTIVGKSWQPDASWGSYKISRVVEYNEPQDLALALVHSDNIYFAQVALEMGAEAFIEQLSALGFGEELPLAYPIAKAQVSNSGNLDNSVLLATAAYGQGELQISSIQLASIFSAIAADGNIPTPRLFLSDEAKIWKENIISQANRQFMQNTLKRTVDETHKSTAQRDYANLAGKSGTVEAAWDADLEQISIDSWFVGYDIDKANMLFALQEQNVHKDKNRPTAAKRFGQIYDLLYNNQLPDEPMENEGEED